MKEGQFSIVLTWC